MLLSFFSRFWVERTSFVGFILATPRRPRADTCTAGRASGSGVPKRSPTWDESDNDTRG